MAKNPFHKRTWANKESSEADLVKSTLGLIKTARRILDLRKGEFARTGIYRVARQRLGHLERQIRVIENKPHRQNVLDVLANDVVRLIGDLCKSLIRYLMSCCAGGYHILRSLEVAILSGRRRITYEYGTYPEDLKGRIEPQAVHLG